MAAQLRRCDSLRGEVEQLAALVAAVADDAEQDADGGEHEPDDRGCEKERERSTRERIAAQRRLGRPLGHDRERRDVRRLARVEPDLARRRRAGLDRVRGRQPRRQVGDDQVAVH